MIGGLVPNLTPSLLLQSSNQQMRGRTLQVHKLATIPSHLLQIKRQSVRCFGLNFFNALPKHIRNITKTTTGNFKLRLDQYLKTIDDYPHLWSGANNGRHNNSNHLFDIIDSKFSEQYITRSTNAFSQGEVQVLPRRLSA